MSSMKTVRATVELHVALLVVSLVEELASTREVSTSYPPGGRALGRHVIELKTTAETIAGMLEVSAHGLVRCVAA